MAVTEIVERSPDHLEILMVDGLHLRFEMQLSLWRIGRSITHLDALQGEESFAQFAPRHKQAVLVKLLCWACRESGAA